MSTVHLETKIHAPQERVFDLARHIDLLAYALGHTGQRAVGGITTGLIGYGQSVTWKARHFGIEWQITSQVTAYEHPGLLTNTLVEGPFKRFVHEHRFQQINPTVTLLYDKFDFETPLGPLGQVVNDRILIRYLRDLLETRNFHIKRVAEGELWKRYLTA